MKFLKYLLAIALVSMYFFSFSFTFLPEAINTKLVFAVLGGGVWAFRAAKDRLVETNQKLIGAICFATLFSAIGFFSADYNHSIDFSYATYIISFSVWLFAGYFVITCLKKMHLKVDFKMLTYYLVGVSVAQCILALLIDNVLIVKVFVDSYIEQGQVFLNNVKRLYGIGASLDNAGVRFSIVLLMIVTLFIKDSKIQKSAFGLILLFVSFLIILTLGSIISRTTTVGGGIAIIYLIVGTGLWRFFFSYETLKMVGLFLGIIVIVITISTYLYQTNIVFYDYMRFAFEGFFNWVEKGEWTTSSTERLNSVMWIWPDVYDTKTWLIGKATFDDWHAVGTDIGYCRFVFYNGLLGLITFSLFFVYNAWAMALKFPQFKLFFVFLLALTFVIWLKVATDLFLIYALLYNLDDSSESEKLYDMYFKKLAL